MKNKNTLSIDSHQVEGITRFHIQTLFVIALLLLTSLTTLQAQEGTYSRPSWYFGAAVGSNFNFYRGSTQMLNESFTPPATFHNGYGAGLYVAPAIEYYKPNTRLGFMFQAGYDSRRGHFNEVRTDCDCQANLDTKLSYITIEPSVRFAPFRNSFYLYAGPRFAFNQDKSFIYDQQVNWNSTNQVKPDDVEGDFSNINNTVISMQIGLGYDIPLNATTSKTQFVLSPFASYHPYFGQNPRDTETWTVATLRAGVVLKFGQGHLIETPVEGEVQFSVVPPGNVTSVKSVREVFPLRNYIFFDKNDTNIPTRYVLLKKNQVADFKEDQVQFNAPKNASGRSQRQMIVYYNVLNILGDRMVKNPSSTITLVGSSDTGREDGLKMAQNIKTYLVSVFGISAARIAVEGREKPEIPSEKAGGSNDLDLLKAGNRRVSIESNSPVLLMEFQSGKEAPLKPVEIITSDQNTTDVVFNVGGAKEVFSSWNVELKDKNGKTQKYGPYTDEQVSIPRKTIMGNQSEGDYKVTLNGTTKAGKSVTKESTIHLAPYVAPQIQESLRFSVIYEYNESKSIAIYEKYLTEIVAPKIPMNGTVVITGHTDIIGETDYNKTLSIARANDVKGILEKSLAAAGRSDVTFRLAGDGEDETLAPFDNRYPEERFYNRTVVIDILK